MLDTHVIISGLISSSGPSAALVDAVYADRLRLAFDRRIINEYAEVMDHPKFGIELQERQALLMKLHSSGLQTQPIQVTIKLPDEDDRPFIEVALATSEPVIVTRNRADFESAEKSGVRVLSPEEALDLMLELVLIDEGREETDYDLLEEAPPKVRKRRSKVG